MLNGSLQYKWKWWNIDRMEMISFQYLSLEATASDWSTWMSYQPVWGMCWQNNGVISSLPAWREWMATSRGKFYFLYDKVLPTIWLWSSKYVGWKKKTFEYYVSQTNEISSDFHVFHWKYLLWSMQISSRFYYRVNERSWMKIKGSYTEKTHEHQASGFCYVVLSDVEDFNIPPVVYRGKMRLRNFWNVC